MYPQSQVIIIESTLRPGILFRALLWVGALKVAAVKRVLSFVMDVRELAPAAGGTTPTIGR